MEIDRKKCPKWVVSHESVEKFPKKFTFLNVSLGKAPYLRSKPGTVSGR